MEHVFIPSAWGASIASGTAQGRWSARVRGRGGACARASALGGVARHGVPCARAIRCGIVPRCRSGGQTARPAPGATHGRGGARRRRRRRSQAPQRHRHFGLLSPHAVEPPACEEAGGASGALRAASSGGLASNQALERTAKTLARYARRSPPALDAGAWKKNLGNTPTRPGPISASREGGAGIICRRCCVAGARRTFCSPWRSGVVAAPTRSGTGGVPAPDTLPPYTGGRAVATAQPGAVGVGRQPRGMGRTRRLLPAHHHCQGAGGTGCGSSVTKGGGRFCSRVGSEGACREGAGRPMSWGSAGGHMGVG